MKERIVGGLTLAIALLGSLAAQAETAAPSADSAAPVAAPAAPAEDVILAYA